MQTLAAALGSQPWVREIKAIETASIPVIKLLADPAVLGCPLPAVLGEQLVGVRRCRSTPRRCASASADASIVRNRCLDMCSMHCATQSTCCSIDTLSLIHI